MANSFIDPYRQIRHSEDEDIQITGYHKCYPKWSVYHSLIVNNWSIILFDDNTIRLYITEDSPCSEEYIYQIPSHINVEVDENGFQKLPVSELYIHSIKDGKGEVVIPPTVEDIFVADPEVLYGNNNSIKEEITSSSLSFSLGETSDFFECIDGSLYKKGSSGISELVFFHLQSEKSQIAKGIHSISKKAIRFKIPQNLIIPDGVSTIESQTMLSWGDCVKQSLTIPSSVTQIDDDAFSKEMLNTLRINNIPSNIKIGIKQRSQWSGYHNSRYGQTYNVTDIQFAAPINLHGNVTAKGVIQLHKAISPRESLAGDDTDGQLITIDFNQVAGIDDITFNKIFIINPIESRWRYYSDDDIEGKHIQLTQISIISIDCKEPAFVYTVYENADEVNRLIKEAKQKS